jgi:hypothetical protein
MNFYDLSNNLSPERVRILVYGAGRDGTGNGWTKSQPKSGDLGKRGLIWKATENKYVFSWWRMTRGTRN